MPRFLILDTTNTSLPGSSQQSNRHAVQSYRQQNHGGNDHQLLPSLLPSGASENDECAQIDPMNKLVPSLAGEPKEAHKSLRAEFRQEYYDFLAKYIERLDDVGSRSVSREDRVALHITIWRAEEGLIHKYTDRCSKINKDSMRRAGLFPWELKTHAKEWETLFKNVRSRRCEWRSISDPENSADMVAAWLLNILILWVPYFTLDPSSAAVFLILLVLLNVLLVWRTTRTTVEHYYRNDSLHYSLTAAERQKRGRRDEVGRGWVANFGTVYLSLGHGFGWCYS